MTVKELGKIWIDTNPHVALPIYVSMDDPTAEDLKGVENWTRVTPSVVWARLIVGEEDQK
jgi:hypothetical protein